MNQSSRSSKSTLLSLVSQFYEATGVWQIVARLEDGCHTIASERRASSSGGEKQCTGIARAMLKDARAQRIPEVAVEAVLGR